MDYRDEAADSPTIKHRLISSCLLSPFRRHNHHHPLSSPRHHRHPSLTHTPSRAWGSRSPVRRRTSDGDLASTPGRAAAAVGKEKCMQFISRIGCGVGQAGGGGGGGGGCGGGGHHHRRRHSVGGDFHYDALSYSLNFDDGNFDDDVSGELPSRDFSARLPHSPPPPPARRNREIQCSF
ncbi:unnamed protein product [Linum tenue]|uniref:Uncharacterized protein n=1 Tax=Linum tenue TaxID=586396 RepID=A0AAV0QAH4_9ROSI|nr:unnamed protein product [Linum tenue]CAI0629557.1 unnamed protein product [Linum tenue]